MCSADESSWMWGGFVPSLEAGWEEDRFDEDFSTLTNVNVTEFFTLIDSQGILGCVSNYKEILLKLKIDFVERNFWKINPNSAHFLVHMHFIKTSFVFLNTRICNYLLQENTIPKICLLLVQQWKFSPINSGLEFSPFLFLLFYYGHRTVVNNSELIPFFSALKPPVTGLPRKICNV